MGRGHRALRHRRLGHPGRKLAHSLAKGTRILIEGRLDQRSWETDAGERRSKTEITAEEIAASLRFATATLTKTERSNLAQTDDSDTPGEEPF